MRAIAPVLLIACMCGQSGARAADSGRTIVSIDDPRHDDFGPGSYLYPTGRPYRAGQFDLRRFELGVDGDFASMTITLDTPLRRPFEPRITEARTVDLNNGVYIQNIDIYIDSVPGRGNGFTDAVPGRNLRFDEDGAWDVAVVLTPRPYEVRAALEGWRPSAQVYVPTGVRSRGTEITARVPLGVLGGRPEPSWGYTVVVSGATWEQSLDFQRRISGAHTPNAYTMRVTTVAEPEAFGGGELTFFHPYVIDILTPPGRHQKVILGRHDASTERLASIPMVYPDPEAHARAVAARPARHRAAEAVVSEPPPAAPGTIESVVRDVLEGTVVLDRPQGELATLRLGAVIDTDGDTVGKLLVTAVHSSFVLATIVDGADAIRPGAVVRFRPQPE